MSPIELHHLTTGYATRNHTHVVSEDLCGELRAGELTALLGVNGAGKSTLMSVLAHFSEPLSGEVKVSGKPLAEYTPKALARQIGVVLTGRMEQQGLTVEDMVGMGRSPYTGFWGKLADEDREKVHVAIRQVGIEHLAHRTMNTLSDGERQKVMIAKVLAQETPLILLDEPTAFLDFPSKVQIMQMLRSLAHDMGKTVLLSTHDIEIVLQMADNLWLLDGKALLAGTPKTLAKEGHLGRFFNIPGIEFSAESLTYRIV